MPQQSSESRKVKGYCGLCIARCGSIATVEGGRFTKLDPDPSHPTGAALCAKGRAAPELVYSKDRLARPLRRTRPKGDADPGWEPISWDDALDVIAGNMRRIADAHGPHAVAFSQSSGSTTAITDSAPFVRRLMNAFGTPNQVSALDLCGWGRGFATRFVYGVASVGTGSGGGAMPDIANAGCLILWGYNPSASRLPHATATVAAMKRGVRLVIILYALTGSFDACGGNVLLPSVPSGAINGDDLPSAKKMAPAIGLEERPLGPARDKYVSAHDFYTAVLEGKPYPVRALIGFGTNLLLAHADPERGRKALAALDFYAHADLFMTPTAEMADIVLPIASAFEREALKIGFEISAEAQSLVQLRQHIVPPRGEARSDTDFIFALADRLGLGQHFWNGDVDAAYRQQLGPSGVTLEQLRADPAGVRVPLTTRYGKHAVPNTEGHAPGFATPSRKIEIWSETLAEHGQSALPRFSEPSQGTKLAISETSASYPLTLTCAKPTVFCQTQHRSIPSLRARALHPELEMHPEAAAARGIVAGSWVKLKTPVGAMRARARLNDKLDPRVVVGEHGWWQACDELGEPGQDPFSVDSSNFNATVDARRRDPVGGTPAHRGNDCEVELESAS